MADKRNIAPDEGPHGVDRWSSNGFGLTINGKEVVPLDTEEKEDDETQDIDEIEEA